MTIGGDPTSDQKDNTMYISVGLAEGCDLSYMLLSSNLKSKIPLALSNLTGNNV